jgi:hypothetical protein
MVDPDVGQCPMTRPYRGRAVAQRNSLIKLDAKEPVNSGTGCDGITQEPDLLAGCCQS